MAILINLKKFVLNSIIIFLFILSTDASALSEQCVEIAKILKANANGYTELVDTKQYSLQQSPFAQIGRENVDSTLKLPSAERCQATWNPEREEFVYMCEWQNEDKEASSANLKIIGDIVEKCLLESNLVYDRVNPKTDENLSFITFYLEKQRDLKIVLMKFGSSIKSRFEFSKNLLPKPGSKQSQNNRYNANAQWPNAVVFEDIELRIENEKKARLAQKEKERQARLEKERLARLEKEKQLQAKKDKQKAEQIALEKPKQLEDKSKSEVVEKTLADKPTVESPVGTKKVSPQLDKASQDTAKPMTAPANGKSLLETAPQSQGAQPLLSNASQSPVAQKEKPKEQALVQSDPSLTTCWYFASYTAMYQEQKAPNSKTFSAALVSNVRSINVNLNEALEQQMKQQLSKKAEQAWETNKPTDSYFYYNLQPFGHVSCDKDAMREIEYIHQTMNSVDWLKSFEASLD